MLVGLDARKALSLREDMAKMQWVMVNFRDKLAALELLVAQQQQQLQQQPPRQKQQRQRRSTQAGAGTAAPGLPAKRPAKQTPQSQKRKKKSGRGRG